MGFVFVISGEARVGRQAATQQRARLLVGQQDSGTRRLGREAKEGKGNKKESIRGP